jgi:hypothetical protein
MFGRSSDLRQLDQALRAVDIHPALVPEGAKLAIVNLMKDHAGGRLPPEHAYRPTAELVGYCMIGAEAFENANGLTARLAAEDRIERAIEAEAEGRSGVAAQDAQFILLTLHAKLIQPAVIERFDLGTE